MNVCISPKALALQSACPGILPRHLKAEPHSKTQVAQTPCHGTRSGTGAHLKRMAYSILQSMCWSGRWLGLQAHCLAVLIYCLSAFSCDIRIGPSLDVCYLEISEPMLRSSSPLPTDGFNMFQRLQYVTILAGPHLLGALGGVELLSALPRIGHTGAHCGWQMGPEAAAVLAQQLNTSLPMISTQETRNLSKSLNIYTLHHLYTISTPSPSTCTVDIWVTRLQSPAMVQVVHRRQTPPPSAFLGGQRVAMARIAGTASRVPRQHAAQAPAPEATGLNSGLDHQ